MLEFVLWNAHELIKNEDETKNPFWIYKKPLQLRVIYRVQHNIIRKANQY